MRKYTLQEHAKSDFIKWFIAFLFISIVTCAVVLIGLEQFGKGKQKPSNWFAKSEAEQTETMPEDEADEAQTERGMIVPAEVVGDDGLTLISKKIAVEDYELYGVSEGAESAYLLTAIVQNGDGCGDNVGWFFDCLLRAGVDDEGFRIADFVTLSSEYRLGFDLTMARGNPVVLTCLQPFDFPLFIEVEATCCEDVDDPHVFTALMGISYQ